jgi:hypothetical protein
MDYVLQADGDISGGEGANPDSLAPGTEAALSGCPEGTAGYNLFMQSQVGDAPK